MEKYQMNNFEFKSYIPTPDDQYMLGLVKIKLYGKIVITFKEVKTKDGTGIFYCTQNYAMKDALGEKKYIACAQLDSRDDEQELQDFIRVHVNQAKAQRSAHKPFDNGILPVQGTQGNYYPHGMAQQTPTQEVTKQDDLPF
jgi:hypothetical protein